jgi:(Z)-2-((N-methylformamido)methylene)-5-hydroxybutyrolactone dehydrogenase
MTDTVAPHAYRMLIDGRWQPSASHETFPSVSPFDGETWATIPSATPEDVDLAVTAARRALEDGPWSRCTGAERARLMRELARVIRDNADRLARIESRDHG